MSDWLKPKELAERLRVSDDTIRNLIHSGKLKAKKIGGQYRIRQDIAEAFESMDAKPKRLGGRSKIERATGAIDEAMALCSEK